MRASVRTRINNLTIVISAFVALAVLLAPAAIQNVFAATSTVCADAATCDYTTIQDAVTAANPGDTISISGTYTITSTIVINKNVSIEGQSGATINTSGGNSVFTITAAGAQVKNLTFNRTQADITGVQNIIGIQANNVSITDNEFNGQYVFGVDGVSRAIVVSPGVTGFSISGNSFISLRQPLYSDGSGVFANNYTALTRGAVVGSHTNVAFTGNTWGTGDQRNILDVAILNNAGGNNYPDSTVIQISDQNNDAVVENQFGGVRVLSDVFVSADGDSSGDGLPHTPYQSIQATPARIANGGTIHVASGAYSTSTETAFDKAVHIKGASTKPQFNITGGGYALILRGTGSSVSNIAFNKLDSANQDIIGIQASGITIDKNTFTGQYVLGATETTRALEVSNYPDITISNNIITGLRQPAYINGSSTGSLLNNSVTGTRGWVIEAHTDYTITDNTFSGNATDVAIIAGSPNNYDCVRTNLIRNTNNNASVDNQALTDPCPENVPPSVPTNGQPHNAYRATNNFFFTWDASTDNHPGTITYEFQSARTNATDGNGSLIGAWNNIANGNPNQKHLTTPTIHSTGASDGTYYWQVRAIDAAGNKSAWSQTWNMTIDTVKPAIPQSLSFSNPVLACNAVTNSYTVTARWDAVSDAAQYEYWVTTPARTDASAWVTPVNTNNYSGSFNEGEGVYTFKVRAIDAAGNKSDWSSTCAVTYDATAPDVFLVSPANNITMNGASVTQTWGTNTPGDVKHYIYESYHNEAATNLRWRETITGTSKTATNVGNTTYWWRVKSVDMAGNESAWSQLRKITIDNTAPAVPILTTPTNDAYINTSTFNFTWSAVSDPSGVTYEWQSSHNATLNSNGAFVSPLVVRPSLTSTTLPSPGTPDNTYYWQVRAKDGAGNYSAWSTPWKVIVDTVAPVITGDDFFTGDGTITPDLTANDSNPGPLTYQWTATDPTYADIISDPNTLNPTFSPTTSGTYAFTIVATDQANNTSSAFTFSFTYTEPENEFEEVDTTPPAPTNTAPQVAGFTANALGFAGAQDGGAAGAAGGNPGAAQPGAADAANDQDGEVLATTTDGQNQNNRTTNGQTLASTTAPEATTGTGFKWWWALVAAAIIGFAWLIIAALRRRQQES